MASLSIGLLVPKKPNPDTDDGEDTDPRKAAAEAFLDAIASKDKTALLEAFDLLCDKPKDDAESED